MRRTRLCCAACIRPGPALPELSLASGPAVAEGPGAGPTGPAASSDRPPNRDMLLSIGRSQPGSIMYAAVPLLPSCAGDELGPGLELCSTEGRLGQSFALTLLREPE